MKILKEYKKKTVKIQFVLSNEICLKIVFYVWSVI